MNFYKKNLLKEKSTALLVLLFAIISFVFVSCSDQKARNDTAALSAKFDEYVVNQKQEKEAEAKAKAEEVALFKSSLDELKSGLSAVKQSISSINAVNAQQTKDIAKIKGAQDLLTNFYDKMDKKYVEMEHSLGEIQGQISDSTKLSSEDVAKINESITLLKESTLGLQANKAEKSDIESLDARIKAIESIDVGALSSRVNSLEEFKVHISDAENANNFVKDLQCIKEYVELITNMQEQINKLQTDIENQKNTGQLPEQANTEQPKNVSTDNKPPLVPATTPESTQPSITDQASVPEVAPVSPADANQPPATN